jgi:hypothetical protein
MQSIGLHFVAMTAKQFAPREFHHIRSRLGAVLGSREESASHEFDRRGQDQAREFLRRRTLTTSLCPAVTALTAISVKMGRLRFRGANDCYRRRARQGATTRRVAARSASRRSPGAAGCPACAGCGGSIRRHTLCRAAHPSCNRATKTPILRRCWKHVLAFVPMAHP